MSFFKKTLDESDYSSNTGSTSDLGKMAPLTMTVRGEASIPHKAERAILDAEIISEGTDRKAVAAQVSQSSRRLQDVLKAMAPEQPLDSDSTSTSGPEIPPPPPLSKWTMASFTTTSYHPRDKDFNPIEGAARVYTTSVPFTLEVQDFASIGRIATLLSTQIPHAKLHNVRWVLTPETQKSYESELRRLAARDALQRARDYASTLGLDNVKAVHLEEEGMGGMGAPAVMRMSSGPKRKMRGGGPNVEEEQSFEDLVFVAEDISMTAGVACKFEAE